MSTRPQVQVEFIDAAPELDHLEAVLMSGELKRAGFEPLGIVREGLEGLDAVPSLNFASAKHRAFASIYLSKRGQPKLYLFTPFEGLGCVLTARYPRTEERTAKVLFSGTGRTVVDVLNEALEAGKDPVAALAPFGLTWPISEDLYDAVLEAPSIEQLLVRHTAAVAAMGLTPYATWDREARLRSIREFYELDEAWGPLDRALKRRSR